MTDRFGLIACSKSKRGKDEPDREFPAQKLYDSWLFNGRAKAVEVHCDQWAIMSAKHGYVDPNERISWYDQRIDELPWAERVELARNIVDELPDVDELMVLMGRDYFEPLSEVLPADVEVWDPLEGVRLFDQRSELRDLASNHEQKTLITDGGQERDDLIPVSPSEAVDLHLEAMQDDSAQWTQYSHKSHLRAFVEWCREEGGVDNMNDLTGRDIYQFRVWRREGGYSKGMDGEIAPKTLDSALTVVRSFLQFCAQIDAVYEDTYEKVPLLSLSRNQEVSDTTLNPERVPPILDYLNRYEYASRDHVIWVLLWHTGARLGGVRSIDLADCDLDGRKHTIEFVHRPESNTPLKNKDLGERVNRISETVATIVLDYIDGPRNEVRDEYGRRPLLTSNHGRVCSNLIRETIYKWTRPCFIGKECPVGEDPKECEYTRHKHMSKCPESRSTHTVRKARVTQYRNDGVPRGVVSDRLDTSEDMLDKHYDRASQREKADRRWRLIRE